MKAARVSVETRVIVVTGWKVGNVLNDAGIRAVYVGTVKGWMVDRHNLGNVLAVLDRAGYDAQVSEVAA